jgi:hypothetical protein
MKESNIGQVRFYGRGARSFEEKMRVRFLPYKAKFTYQCDCLDCKEMRRWIKEEKKARIQ